MYIFNFLVDLQVSVPWFEIADENDFKIRILLTPGNKSVCAQQFQVTYLNIAYMHPFNIFCFLFPLIVYFSPAKSLWYCTKRSMWTPWVITILLFHMIMIYGYFRQEFRDQLVNKTFNVQMRIQNWRERIQNWSLNSQNKNLVVARYFLSRLLIFQLVNRQILNIALGQTRVKNLFWSEFQIIALRYCTQPYDRALGSEV